MSEFLSAYSVQRWLESCPQGYLEGTEFGHAPGEKEPDLILENPKLRDEAIRTTVQLIVGERCALAASSGLINAAPDEASKRFLATQTLDEARHVEIFSQRLLDLGVKKSEFDSVIKERANPHLVEFASILLEKVDRNQFTAGVVGQNIILEGMAFSVFEMMRTMNRQLNPRFARMLDGTIADERRHVGFGENRIGSLIKQYPARKPEIERMQREMSYHMLATFADAFRAGAEAFQEGRELGLRREAKTGLPREKASWQGANLNELSTEEIEGVLRDTVLKEFKVRLGRIGLEYQSPAVP